MNPYRRRKKFELGSQLPGQQAPFASERTGEINASSRQDLLQQIDRLIQASLSGQVQVPSRFGQMPAEVYADRQNTLLEAVNDKSGGQMQILGEALVAEIYDTATREGFARRLLQYREIGTGENNEVRIRQRDVMAYVAVSPSEVAPTMVRARLVKPPEFNIEAFVTIDLKELGIAPGDLLEEKYEEGLEATMVAEDRLWKKMADQAAVIRNTLQYFPSFTPQILSRLRTQVSNWGIPAPTAIIAYDLWDDIIGNAEFSALFDPVTKYELLQEGVLGTILGLSVLTDGLRHENLRVLEAGDVYVVGAPVYHGVYTVRGTMLVEPINQFAQGKSTKGWFIHQLASMVLGNPASVSRGKRI